MVHVFGLMGVRKKNLNNSVTKLRIMSIRIGAAINIRHPKISHAEVFINGIEHAMQKTDNPDETRKQLVCIGWSNECKETILEALECYKVVLLQQAN